MPANQPNVLYQLAERMMDKLNAEGKVQTIEGRAIQAEFYQIQETIFRIMSSIH